MVTIYECDFCKQQKACKKKQIGNLDYDICEKCEEMLAKKLEGRGTQRFSLQSGPTVIYTNTPTYWYGTWWQQPVITPVYTPTWPTITVTTPAQNSNHTYTTGTLCQLSSGNDMT